MKKIISAAAILAASAVFAVSAYADVYVTISDDKGKLVLAQESVELSDADGDGAVTINDVLINAHDANFDGGADAGYGNEEGDYGLMLTKLWGIENGGSYGYYVNNVSAMGLTDPVNDGDYINAFAYTDLTGWSDTYCYFNVNTLDFDDVTADGSYGAELILNAAAFDENWAPITVPVAGATITIDGKKTDYVTDENGWVMIDEIPAVEGHHIISAVSDTQTLVPPVCIATVTLAAQDTGSNISEDIVTAGDVDAATDSSKGSPDTGIADVAAVAGVAILAAGALVVSRKRK